jgi:integrase
MASVYQRGGSRYLYMSVFNPRTGKYHDHTTGLSHDKRAEAQAMAEEVERQLAAEFKLFGAKSTPLTVALYAERFLEGRRARGLHDVKTDEGRLRKHLIPSPLGRMLVHDVRPSHCRHFARALTARCGSGDEHLAPRTVINVCTLVRTMFEEAVSDELIPQTPWALKKGDLPKKSDKDPEWRATAVFSLDELEQLLSLNDQVPPDRWVLYNLLALTGQRFGTVAALRWRHYHPALEPLGRLLFAVSYNTKTGITKRTKTEAVFEVPVTPMLKAVLECWRTAGWPWLMGRASSDDDLIIPSREGDPRSVTHADKKFHEDLERLGLRRRRVHDLRRSYITLARAQGARTDVIQCITHRTRADMMNAYTSFDWKTLCEEAGKLRVQVSDRRSPRHRRAPVWSEWFGLRAPIETGGVLQLSCSPPTAATLLKEVGGVDGTRTRGLRRDRPAL